MFPLDADDAVELLKNADTAMFRSKKAGPGGYVVHTADDADAMSGSRSRRGCARPSSRSSGRSTTSR